MASRLDVAERLVEGRPAVERTHSYVQACQQVGYHHPDLTAHPAQISDWYDGEDGLDLYALDGDCAQLRAAGTAVAGVLRMQRAQLAELAAAWTGPGAAAAVAFLQRHCDAADGLVAEIRAAAQRCESLRDNLWQLIDSKVESAIAIDDRTLAQRPAWLAAADTVRSGVGDRPAAEQVLRSQVAPYLDNDIRMDWLTVMRSTRAGVTAAYDMVTDRLASAPRAHFEVPGDLGRDWRPVTQGVRNAPKAPAVTPAGLPDAVQPDTVPAAATPLTPASSTPLAMPSDLGARPGDGVLGGLGGLANRIVDAMVDVLGAAGDGLSDLVQSDDSLETEGLVAADAPDEHRDDGLRKAENVQDVWRDVEVTDPVDQEQPGAEPQGAATAVPPIAQQPPGAAPPPHAGGPPAAGPLPAPAPAEGSTPCEIAADELPKAGQ